MSLGLVFFNYYPVRAIDDTRAKFARVHHLNVSKSRSSYYSLSRMQDTILAVLKKFQYGIILLEVRAGTTSSAMFKR